MPEPHRILLIEDDELLAETTRRYLEGFGFQVRHASDGETGLTSLTQRSADLVLLDLMLPGIDGLEVCRRLRSSPATARLPILMLTARGDETDRVVGLEMGADDYLPKPYSLRELVARIRAVLRRASREGRAAAEPTDDGGEPSSRSIEIGPLLLDQGSRRVSCRGLDVELTATEFDLLWLFASRPGRVLSRTQLLDLLRGREFDSFDRSIDVHVSKLRKKLEPDPKSPTILKTVWGVGYVLDPKAGAE